MTKHRRYLQPYAFWAIVTITLLLMGRNLFAQVMAYNPTPYPREQVVVFGAPTKPDGAKLLTKLPKSSIYTARVRVPAMHNGRVEFFGDTILPPVPDLKFRFSQELPWRINGTPFREVEPVAFNEEMLVRHLIAKTDEGIISHLFVYQGWGEDWCRYEYVATLESLDAASKTLKVRLTLDDSPLPAFDRLQGPLSAAPGYQGRLKDRQGFCSYGAVLRRSGPSEAPTHIATKAGVAIWELTTCGVWPSWGPWDTLPGGNHQDRKVNRALLAHRGVLLEKGPGQTGEQYGFGVWKHLDAIRPGQIHRLAHDRAAVIQEACRPIWLFEPDGSLASVEKHPQFVSWDETWHWHPNIGIDRFGRTYSHGGWYEGWAGMDRQHYSAVALSEDVLLRGGYLSQFILKMKTFHFLTEIGYPTAGRALGRYMFAARDLYVATGDERIVTTCRDKWKPSFVATWTAINTNWVKPADVKKAKPFALRLIADDPHTKIPGAEWVCWEDGIAIQGLDIMGDMLNDPEIKLACYLLAKSVVNHGFDENGRIYKAIKWNSTPPPPHLGPQIALSTNTNYTEWAAPGLGICMRISLQFGDKATSDRAAELLRPVIEGGYANLDSYLGPIGGRR